MRFLFFFKSKPRIVCRIPRIYHMSYRMGIYGRQNTICRNPGFFFFTYIHCAGGVLIYLVTAEGNTRF